MVDVTQPAGTTRPAPAGAQTKPPSGLGAAIQALEIDTRLIGMLIALAVIWIGFHIFSGGVFLTPRNLWNLSVQTSSVAVMATGMVLVIVSRNIDLSVGSVLGFIGMVMAAVQVEILPHYVGFDWPFTWIITLAVGIGVGALIGAVQGGVIAYLGVPAFIVTLGGLLVWRGAAWWVAQGRTIAPLDTNFQRIGGGGLHGSIGGTASWVVAAIACIGIVLLVMNERRQRRRFHFPLRPVWAEFTIAIVGCILVLGAVSVINAYPLPIGLARQFAEANGIPWPEGGLFISLGIAIPVLIALGAGIVMTFVATRTRFGRYVFAIGGNPEAADLAGVNTRWIVLKVFVLMGMLCGVSAAISTSRLNAGTNSLGTLDELYTIAAAVIGGTSLAGGVGTIAGAILGALVIQSLQSGMVLIGIPSPLQNIVVGIVLVLAVWLDQVYRRRSA
jgi:D-xylose transport system permease protein